MPKKLLDQVRDEIRYRHYSIRTEEAYTQWIKRFILYHNKKHPAQMGAKEIKEYLTYLAVKQKVASSTQNQALNALVFLYKEVLKLEIADFSEFKKAKRPAKIPLVLNEIEIDKLFQNLDGVYYLIAKLLYGSGLRLLEALRLRVKDIDFTYKEITVRDGKGAKDRYIPLPD